MIITALGFWAWSCGLHAISRNVRSPAMHGYILYISFCNPRHTSTYTHIYMYTQSQRLDDTYISVVTIILLTYIYFNYRIRYLI